MGKTEAPYTFSLEINHSLIENYICHLIVNVTKVSLKNHFIVLYYDLLDLLMVLGFIY